MLAKRIIVCLDVLGGRVVKGVGFRSLRDAGDPAELARFYQDEGADEIVFLDISASNEGRKMTLEAVSRTADGLFIPFTVGGGISTTSDIRDALLAGADKVSINTAAVLNPDLIAESAARFGSQCIVVAIDAKRVSRASCPVAGDAGPAPRFRVFTHGGTVESALDATGWAGTAEHLGAGEILLTSIDADGTNRGFDLALTRAVRDATGIPVIASGGAGRAEHFLSVFSEGGADAALAASIFHYGAMRVRDVKAHLAAEGVLVRV